MCSLKYVIFQIQIIKFTTEFICHNGDLLIHLNNEKCQKTFCHFTSVIILVKLSKNTKKKSFKISPTARYNKYGEILSFEQLN